MNHGPPVENEGGLYHVTLLSKGDKAMVRDDAGIEHRGVSSAAATGTVTVHVDDAGALW